LEQSAADACNNEKQQRSDTARRRDASFVMDSKNIDIPFVLAAERHFGLPPKTFGRAARVGA